MSICEYSVNMNNKCGSCKYFKLYDETGIFGFCSSPISKIKNKQNRSIKSKACINKEDKDEQ